MNLRESLDNPVSQYSTSKYISVSPEDSVSEAAKKMKAMSSTEAVVTKGGSPIGIITERDILYKVVSEGLDPKDTRVRSIMTSPVATVEHDSKVGDAILKMTKLNVRRLGVTKSGNLVGIITQKSVLSGDTSTNAPLPELAKPGMLACPYCGAAMKDRKELSRHIDQVHLGMGLLEGDVSKW